MGPEVEGFQEGGHDEADVGGTERQGDRAAELVLQTAVQIGIALGVALEQRH